MGRVEELLAEKASRQSEPQTMGRVQQLFAERGIAMPKSTQPTPTQINRQDAAVVRSQTKPKWNEVTLPAPPSTPREAWKEVKLPSVASTYLTGGTPNPSQLDPTQVARQRLEQLGRPKNKSGYLPTSFLRDLDAAQENREAIAEYERLRENPDFAEVSKRRTTTTAERSQGAYHVGSAVGDMTMVRPDTVLYDTVKAKGGTQKDIDERTSMETTGGKDLADIPEEVADLYYYIRNTRSIGEAQDYLELTGWAPYYAMRPDEAFVQGATKDVGAQSLLTVFNGIAHGKESAERLQKALDELNAKAQKDHPVFSGAGNVTGTMALAVPLALGGGAAAGAAGLGGAGTAVVSGAVGMGGTTAIQEAGDLASGRKDVGRYLGDVVGSSFAGAAGSGVSYGLGKVGSAALQRLGLADNALARGTVGLVRGGGSAATRVGITEGVEYLQDHDGYEFNAQDALNQVLVSGVFDAIMSAATKPAAPKTAMVANGQGADMSAEEDLLLRQTFGENYQKMSADEIAKAYRTQAHANHPDLVGSAGEEAMKRLNAARDIYQRLFSGKAYTAYQAAQTARASGDTAAYQKATADFANSVNGLQTIIETDTSTTPKVAEAMQILNAVSASMGRDAAGYAGQLYNNAYATQKTASTEKAGSGNVRLTESDSIEYMATGKKKSVRDAKAAEVERGGSVVLTTERETKEFIGDAIRGVAGQVTKAYGKVGAGMAEDIQAISKSDVDVTGWFLELVPDDLRHAFEQHQRAKKKGNIDLTEQDFLNIPDYIDSYDDILEVREFKSGDREVVIGKKINGYSIIVELISNKRKSLHFKNMWGLDTPTYESRYGKSTASHPDRSSVSANDPTGVYHGTFSKLSIPQTLPDVKAPTKSQDKLTRDTSMSSAFQTITSAARLAGRTDQAKAALEQDVAMLQRDFETIAKAEMAGEVTPTDTIELMKIRSATLRVTIEGTRYIGQGKKVDDALAFLDQLDDFLAEAAKHNTATMLDSGMPQGDAQAMGQDQTERDATQTPGVLESGEDIQESERGDKARHVGKSILSAGRVTGFEGLTTDMRQAFREGLKTASPETQELLRQWKRKAQYRLAPSKRSYYRTSKGVITIGRNATASTVAHELFHWVDDGGHISSQLLDPLMQDYVALKMASEGSVKEYLIQRFPEMFKADNVLLKARKMRPEYRGVADILNGLSEGKEYYGYGHRPEYWAKPGSVEEEAWAQFGRHQYENIDVVLKMFQELFPNFYRSAIIQLKELR